MWAILQKKTHWSNGAPLVAAAGLFYAALTQFLPGACQWIGRLFVARTARRGRAAHAVPRKNAALSACHSIDEKTTLGNHLLAEGKPLDDLNHVPVRETSLYRS
jgi:hypothetical protein